MVHSAYSRTARRLPEPAGLACAVAGRARVGPARKGGSGGWRSWTSRWRGAGTFGSRRLQSVLLAGVVLALSLVSGADAAVVAQPGRPIDGSPARRSRATCAARCRSLWTTRPRLGVR